MKRIFTSTAIAAAILVGIGVANAGDDVSSENYTIREDGRLQYTVFSKTPFYDGYKTDVVVDADKNDGILRNTNYFYARPLPDGVIPEDAESLLLDVEIGALCDNYDRMGRVSIAFVEKGKEYNPDEADRIEIARFITPFMNKNKKPDAVPYVYEIDDVRQILQDEGLRGKYDFIMEVELFGIPYAANQQIAGCEGRNDVFNATVNLAWTQVAAPDEERELQSVAPVTLIPINHAKCEIFGNVNLNNYKEEATDTLGTTTRTFEYSLPTDVDDAQIVLVMTNHGAGEDGEEYVRRKHLIYVDGEIQLVYTPGGVSCEPYREYNTQPNGIYSGMRPPAFWSNFSNWCPGQAVPIRRIPLGSVKAGKHELMIRVPDAEFAYEDGDFRPSLYFMGVTGGKVNPSEVNEILAAGEGIEFRRDGDMIYFVGNQEVKEVNIYSFDGRMLEGRYNPGESISLSSYGPGQYIIVATNADGATFFTKVLK